MKHKGIADDAKGEGPCMVTEGLADQSKQCVFLRDKLEYVAFRTIACYVIRDLLYYKISKK